MSNELKTEIIVLDSTTAKTPKSEKALLKKISDSDSYICIATQMIFSHRFQKMFGYTDEELTNITKSDLLADADLEELIIDRLALLQEQEVITGSHYEIRYREDGMYGEIILQLRTKYTIEGVIAAADIIPEVI